MSAQNITLIGLLFLTFIIANVSAQNNCTNAPNTYWTGYRCACKVGYKNQSDACVPLTLIKTLGWVVREPIVYVDQDDNSGTVKPIEPPAINNNCYLPFEYYDGKGCVCLDGYTRVNGLCQQWQNNPNPIECPSNSIKIGNECLCTNGYIKVNNICIQSGNSNSGCGSNSYDNGLGFCVCASGYYKVNGTCVSGKPCPPSSTRNSNGQCNCDAGLTKYGDFCSKCPLGAIFDSKSQKCVYVCGQKAAYDATQQKCFCLQGYGVYDDVCGTCPPGYFIKDNYCVTCPINSVYNLKNKRCDCSEGYSFDRFGFCVKKCGNNQIYNSVNGNCECMLGLGKVNGVCQICPNGFALSSDGNCVQCSLNQKLVDGRCVCSEGFISNQFGVCVSCTSRQGAFLINSQCATCPGDLVYNGQRCACPAGKTRVGTKCQQTCKLDQLIDQNGLCYTCPIYETISEGKCVCQRNYLRNSTTGQCELTCPQGQFKYQGRCAQCPLNLQYRSEIGGCACRDGQYLNTFGVCEQIVLPPIECTEGQYFDRTFGCVSCPVGCRSCSSATTCTSCIQTGFSVVNGVCQALCGDGLLASGEQCDDRNLLNGDGCSSTCRIETYFICSGQPSVCTYNGPAICGNRRIQAGETCDDGNLINGDGCSDKCLTQAPKSNTTTVSNGLSLSGKISTNMNNVFLTLKTSKQYKFSNDNEMQSFIKTRFPDSNLIPSVYCTQREAPELDLFECLILYNSGIPNQKYNIEFSYNYQGDTGSLTVEVDPLLSSVPSKSRKL